MTQAQIDWHEAIENNLKNHDFIIHHFKRALGKAWPTNDNAVRQPLLPSNDMQTKMRSSTKQSVDVAGITGVYMSKDGVKKSKLDLL